MSETRSTNPADLEENDFLTTLKKVPGLFTKHECEQIIRLSENLPLLESVQGDDGQVDLYTRSSRVRWMNVTQDRLWIFERINDAINNANKWYKFNIIGCHALQVTQYPVGGHYNRHLDIGPGVSTRKISLTVQLSPSDDYSGGDVEFDDIQPDKVKNELRQQGTALIFPSYLPHKVTIVTKGCRWSIVAWFVGPPFS